jgi:4'-phosphopantetheinyl transferase
MDAPGWLSRRLSEVPPGDDWLGDEERLALAALRMGPRRDSWRLGRWTAKAALGAWLSLPPPAVQVLAAADGAPEAWVGGERAPVSISISHRGDLAVAVVSSLPRVVGCDLELIEPRSDAFVREWLSAPERRQVLARGEDGRELLANLFWTAKEAASKVRREGLRLNVRRSVVDAGAVAGGEGRWAPIEVRWEDGAPPAAGWWSTGGGWVLTVISEPRADPPKLLWTGQRIRRAA